MGTGIFAELASALERGEKLALVTIIAAHGSTPQRVGAKMVVFADGRTIGTIGGGCYENDAAWKAREAIRTRQSQVVRYELSDDVAEESGLICGGQMDVFIEPIEPAPSLYVVGAGHVGYHLARFAHALGFRVHVLDDREKFANAERFPMADEVAVGDIADWLQRAALPPHAYVVIVTRGHRYDLDALRAVVTRELRYVGMIGSRAKTRRLFDALLAESIPASALERVHAPIGLDLGAVTPEEIALSIAAELVGVRSGRLAGPRGAAAPLAARRPEAPAQPSSTPTDR
jgi:xanthine dehydrogenase accessory factor